MGKIIIVLHSCNNIIFNRLRTYYDIYGRDQRLYPRRIYGRTNAEKHKTKHNFYNLLT